jgi:hypothetical protein
MADEKTYVVLECRSPIMRHPPELNATHLVFLRLPQMAEVDIPQLLDAAEEN